MIGVFLLSISVFVFSFYPILAYSFCFFFGSVRQIKLAIRQLWVHEA